jgi:small-conductance mechanosensitive channel
MTLSDLLDVVRSAITAQRTEALTWLLIGAVVSVVAGRLATRLPLATGLEKPIRRLVTGVLAVVFVATALSALDYDLSVLLGAAGFATVAVGFAAQTTASNAISGVFLLGERPFQVGDTIEVGGTRGIVLSIDVLSVKLRTFDNIYVRVPNETVMKSEIRNLSKFPIRRADVVLRIPHAVDQSVARSVLLEAVSSEPLALVEPEAQVFFNALTDSGVELQLSVWAAKEDWLPLRIRIAELAPRALESAGIPPGVPVRKNI